MKNAEIDEPTGLDPYESETINDEMPGWVFALLAVFLFVTAPLRWFK